jgi:MFS transporter, NNP family, nitrate/nitrite transporter
MPKIHPNDKWVMLVLLTFTGTFAVAMPFSCMPVLFKEISDDLGLNLVQIGTVWGIASLAGIFVSLGAGVLGDRFGMKPLIGVCCILVGITGALRGISDSFFTLTVLVFINGLVRLIVPVNATKAVGMWFKGKHLGMAMGVTAMGVGLGLMLGPMISASVLSPWLGGWRNVMYLYGAVSALIGIIWLIFGKEAPEADNAGVRAPAVHFKQAFSRLIRNKGMWLVGLTMMLRVACITGMAGYLPLYLRDNRGWANAAAGSTLAVYFAVSTACVIPLSLLSDRLGSRKAILFPGLLIPAVCVGLIPFVNDSAIWVLMVLAGICMDSFMAVTVTLLMETEGVGAAYAGTALGIVFTINQIAAAITPPIGNSLAGIDPTAAFLFWGTLPIIGIVTLFFATETGRRKIKSLETD